MDAERIIEDFPSNPFTGIRKLGILGGMGSLASSRFAYDLCRLTARGEVEQRQLPFLLDSAPDTPDRTEMILKGKQEELSSRLTVQLQRMIEQDASHIVICCFSYHNVLHKVPELIRRRVVSLADYTNGLLKGKSGNYLLLATVGSYRLNLFKATNGVFYPSARDQKDIHRNLYRIKQGETDATVFHDLAAIIRKYEFSGLILGCTELYLISDEFESNLADVSLINPLKVMSRDIIHAWKESRICCQDNHEQMSVLV